MTDPKSMIERAARAIHDSNRYLGHDDRQHKSAWRQNRALRMIDARAAIEAMREPTKAMVRHGVGVAIKNEDEIHMRDAAVVWKMMIDKALEDA